MPFDIAGAKQAGYSDDEIAAHLAQSRGFDLQGALKAGYSSADVIQHLSQAPAPEPMRPGGDVVNAIGKIASAILPQASPRPGGQYLPTSLFPAKFAAGQPPQVATPPDQQAQDLKQQVAWQSGEMGKSAQLAAGFLSAPKVASGAGSVAGTVADAVAPRTRLINPAKTAFNEVKAVAGDVPVKPGNAWQSALELRDYAKLTGEHVPASVKAFLNRVTPGSSPLPGYAMKQPPLTYTEARQLYSAASKLSVDELNKLTPTMKAKVGQFVADFGGDIENAAGSVGKQQQYNFAMRKFAQGMAQIDRHEAAAALLKKTLINAATNSLGIGGLGYAAYKVFSDKK